MRKGFTLIEFVVIIAIIAVLIGLLIPAINAARNAASVNAAAAKRNVAENLPDRLEVVSGPLEIGSQSKLYIVKDKQTEIEFVYATDNFDFGSLMPLRASNEH